MSGKVNDNDLQWPKEPKKFLKFMNCSSFVGEIPTNMRSAKS